MLLIKNNKLYDAIKYVAQIFLPAAGTFYFTVAQVWNWSNGTSVVGTIVAFDTLLGVLLHLSSTAYMSSGAKYDGEMNINETDSKKHYALELHTHPDDLDGKKEVVFKVNAGKKPTKHD